MKRKLSIIYALLVGILAVFLLALNLRLYHSPSSSPAALIHHLNWQKEQLQRGSAERMQRLFPEGYFFSYCLYGAAWIDLAVADPAQKKRALEEARWALEHLEGEQGRAVFPIDLPLQYGVFYRGWTNWLRGGVVRLEPEAGEAERFRSECQSLAQAFAASESPYLEAYPRQAWPCDSTVAVASLALHDSLFEKLYEADIENWLQRTGSELFPHQARPLTTDTRGTSQVMIQRFLFEIDPELAARQYRDFRKRFVTTRFGLPGTREYPVGQWGLGDVDSGPLVFGFSFSATGVMPGAARLHQDEALLRPFGQLIHTFGFPVAGRYLGGQLPVADALLVWSRSATSWTGKKPARVEFEPVVGPFWRWGFHLFWLLLVGLAAAPLYFFRKATS